MRLTRLGAYFVCLLLMVVAAPSSAQDFRGRINGTVTDNTGAVLPGVTVTASSPALIQPQVQVTGAEAATASSRCPRASTPIDFELAGFQNVKREGIRVVINQTLTVDSSCRSRRCRRPSPSPAPRRSSTRPRRQMGTNFTKELLTEIPNAPRHLGRHGAGAGHPDDRVRRRRLAHRHADRLPLLRLRHAEPDQARRHRHHRRHRRQRRLLRLRQLRRVPGRRRGRGRRQLRRRRGAEHQRQVGRRSLHAALVQRLASASARSPTTCPTTSARANTRDEDGFFTRTPLDARQPDQDSSTTSTATSAARSGSRRRGSSTATA